MRVQRDASRAIAAGREEKRFVQAKCSRQMYFNQRFVGLASRSRVVYGDVGRSKVKRILSSFSCHEFSRTRRIFVFIFSRQIMLIY